MKTPPKVDELEISLFGPGVGECVVIHLGQGNWMVVDSCWNEQRDRSIASEYLSNIGVNIKTQVKVVVATHWHDDHINGISELLAAARQSEFVCSGALLSKEFLALVDAGRSVLLIERSSGVSEFQRVLEVLRQRPGCGRNVGPHQWAQEGTILFKGDETRIASAHALSPSAQTITETIMTFSAFMPELGSAIKRFPAPTPNETSVAIHVDGGCFKVLLGADLETGTNQKKGWLAVLSSKRRPAGCCAGYKVAHHGSKNADHDEIWSKLLCIPAHAVLTPYACLKEPLPTREDVDRIKSREGPLYSTVWPPKGRAIRRDKAIARTLKDMGAKMGTVRRKPGHIRMRAPLFASGRTPTIELFDGAKQL